LPLGSDNLSAAEVLKFRDQSYHKYHSNPKFLNKIEKKYGKVALNNVIKMNKIKLKRRLVEVMEQ